MKVYIEIESWAKSLHKGYGATPIIRSPVCVETLHFRRKRMGYKGFEKLLKEILDLAKRENLAKPKEFDKIYLDTTVQEKNIAFPTDGRLYFKGIRLLNKCAARAGIKPK